MLGPSLASRLFTLHADSSSHLLSFPDWGDNSRASRSTIWIRYRRRDERESPTKVIRARLQRASERNAMRLAALSEIPESIRERARAASWENFSYRGITYRIRLLRVSSFRSRGRCERMGGWVIVSSHQTMHLLQFALIASLHFRALISSRS